MQQAFDSHGTLSRCSANLQKPRLVVSLSTCPPFSLPLISVELSGSRVGKSGDSGIDHLNARITKNLFDRGHGIVGEADDGGENKGKTKHGDLRVLLGSTDGRSFS